MRRIDGSDGSWATTNRTDLLLLRNTKGSVSRTCSADAQNRLRFFAGGDRRYLRAVIDKILLDVTCYTPSYFTKNLFKLQLKLLKK